MHEHLVREFIKTYGESDEKIRIFRSPGRVNLIGEYIVYNGGHVLPAALSMYTTVLARKMEGRTVRLMATDLKYVVQAELDRLKYYKAYKWGNYQLGVAAELMNAGYDIPGCEMLFEDKVPLGGGLSSSAAIEVASALAFSRLGGHEIDMTALALISQKAEHNYVGVNCGIMDQFASAMGRANHAILLDCRDLSYRHIPIDTSEYRLVIANTNKKRSLGDSAYNQRRSECETALAELKPAFPGARFLCDISLAGLMDNIGLIKDANRRKRAVHAASENERVLEGAKALESGNTRRFGELMVGSHESLRDDYEVSCKELDILVEAALAQDGTAGSRMTGAGFGGCTVSLVKCGAVDSFIENTGSIYSRETGLEASFYVSETSDGGTEVS
ncbi:MAG: galactokinase [Clostridia bacterium]|nr:galactokinase [Clostridia bacterium]